MGVVATRALRLGVVGSSAGNGHPYSWSALINGFDPRKLSTVPFSKIRQYIPEAVPIGQRIGASVTHVWSPVADDAKRIADFALVEKAPGKLIDLVAEVDAVLHARDDYANNLPFARAYSSSRKPVYFDKAIAGSLGELKKFLHLDPELKLFFTGSALAYDPHFSGFEYSGEDLSTFVASGPNSWDLYAVHLIDPFVKLHNRDARVSRYQKELKGQSQTLTVAWSDGSWSKFTNKGYPDVPFSYELNGVKVTLNNPVAAFSAALEAFVCFAKSGKRLGGFGDTLKSISLLETGL